MARKTLEQIFAEDDELNLLNVKPSQSRSVLPDEAALGKFEEINLFVDRHGRLPGGASVSEKSLQIRLTQYLNDPTLRAVLIPHDRHGLFVEIEPAPQSLDDIFDLNDPLLTPPGEDIFTFRHARPASAIPDKFSQRKPCEDFDYFKPILDKCVDQLETGERDAIPFAKEQEITPGNFFILNGVLVYVAEVNEPHIRNGKKNARLRLIFDNGTEGENLLRSLATELYKDKNGRRVTNPKAGPLFNKVPQKILEVAETSEENFDGPTGILYVVRSLSTNPQIAALDGLLFKIGFTSGELKTRIQNAKDDPTFLFAPVHPVATYSIHGATTNKIESIIHKFFVSARLNIELPDRFGKSFKPREWFMVSPDLIKEAVERVTDGSIVNFRYDHKYSKILKLEAN